MSNDTNVERRLTSILRRFLGTLIAGLSFAAVMVGCQSSSSTKSPESSSSEVAAADQEPTVDVSANPSAPVAESIHPTPLPEAAETFDAAWTLVYETHFDPAFNGVDWEAVRDELRPRAAKASSTNELRSVLRDMVSRLNQSHFAILPNEVVDAMDPEQWEDEAESPPEPRDDVADQSATTSDSRTTDSAASGDAATSHDADVDDLPEASSSSGDRFASPGMEVRLLGNEVLVTRVRPGFPAALAGVKPGWSLEAIGSSEVRQLVDRLQDDVELDDRFRAYQVSQVVTERLRGSADSHTPEIRFRDENGDVTSVSLKRVREPGVPVKFGNLPTMVAQVDDHLIEDGENEIGYIAFNIWMIPVARPFHVAIDKYRETDGIIIDLRGNPGGVGGMSMGIAGHFFNDQQRLGTMKTRSTDLNFVANPRRTTADRQPTQPFAGPVAILVDEGTASTSEIFAGGLQAVGRARIFGSTTMGAALPAQMTRLPNGDVLLHAFADYVDANGEHLEGRGVVPDVPIAPTREQLLDGRDPAVDAAVEWIESRTHNSSAQAAA